MPLVGTAGDDQLVANPGGDTLSGLGGADTLIGGAGDDSLAGGDGADQILGAAGADTLSGGAGANIFQYAQFSDSPLGFALSGGLSRIDHIVDWTSADFLQLFGQPTATGLNYQEITAADFPTAAGIANAGALNGIVYTVAQIGHDVVVIDVNGGYAIDLVGVTLSDIGPTNIGSTPGVIDVNPPGSHPIIPGDQGAVTGSMDAASLVDLHVAAVSHAASNEFTLLGSNGVRLDIQGTGFTFSNGQLIGGAVSSFDFNDVNAGGTVLHIAVNGAGFDAAALVPLLNADNTTGLFTTVLANNDTLSGTAGGRDVIHGYGGADVLYGNGGTDSLFGGDGDDTIFANAPPGVAAAAGAPSTYLRGEAGDDSIVGGVGFDDINGNMGNDTIDGGAGPGGDWLVGGQNNDSITAHAGQNLLYGNLGNDTLVGGNGGDVIRGGQGDDSMAGGSGNDFISGDRGNDTMSGGGGADNFHSSQDAGIDKVLDFHVSEGDRVELDPGTTYTVSQVGADTVIDMGNGNQLILVGVQMSSLHADSIFLG